MPKNIIILEIYFIVLVVLINIFIFNIKLS